MIILLSLCKMKATYIFHLAALITTRDPFLLSFYLYDKKNLMTNIKIKARESDWTDSTQPYNMNSVKCDVKCNILLENDSHIFLL